LRWDTGQAVKLVEGARALPISNGRQGNLNARLSNHCACSGRLIIYGSRARHAEPHLPAALNFFEGA
jgi:hypothetical protein